jgi:hypothetical protein
VWLPAALKARIEDLAYQRHQEVAALIADVFADWQPFKGGKPAAPTERHQIQTMIEATVRAELAKMQRTAPASRPAAVPASQPVDVQPVVQAQSRPQAAIPPFDTTRFVLGRLCKAGHEFAGTGQSLLRLKQHDCPACENERKRQRRRAQAPAS